MILVTGESLIDMLPAADACLRPAPGGSPFNVAMALGRLKVPVSYLCPISTDAFGQRLAATLADSGVDLRNCRRTEALSTLGFVTMDPASGGNQYAFYTQGTAGCALEVEDLPLPLSPGIRAIQIGSFALAVEPFGTAIETLVAAHAEDRLVALDPNIRPFLIRDESGFRKRLDRLIQRAHLIKASVEDLAWLEPGRRDVEVAARWIAQGVRLVVITRGADGAAALSKAGQIEIPAPAVNVVDTVGAGDTFQAGLLTWLHEHGSLEASALERLSMDSLRSLLSFAANAAAINCSRVGCDPPHRSEFPTDV